MLILAMAAGAVALAQEKAAVELSNGVALRVETSFGNPTGQQQITPEMLPATGNSFYRIFRDQNGLAVFAYRLQVDRPSGGDEFHLSVRPAGTDFAAKVPNADGGKPTPTISDARDLPVTHGEPIRFDVFQLQGTGESVVDTIYLEVTPEPGPAGPAALRFANLRVFINRALVSPGATGVVTGRFAMFYLPGQGGYFFSSAPVTGRAFLQAGWIDRTRMQFTIDNQVFDCAAESPILAGADRGEIWVFHDPGYAPAGNWTKPLKDRAADSRPPAFFTGAADTLTWWIR